MPWVRPLAYLLPATHGAIDLRTVMLLGAPPAPQFLLGPLALGLVCFGLATLGMRRQLQQE